MEKPLAYRDRTLHQLPEHTIDIQETVKDLDIFCKTQQMVINEKKTKTVVFNTAITKDFYPRLKNTNNVEYENVEEFKLLGVDFITHSKQGIKWDTYVNKLIRSSYANLWILKRLLVQGVSIDDLLLTYTSRVRQKLEQNVPLWHFAISKELSQKLENVQKACLFVILGNLATTDYHCNLLMLNLEPLYDRREKLCKTFARKSFKHPVHRNMFELTKGQDTRSNQKVPVPMAKTARYGKSAIPNLAKLINFL